MKIEMHDVTIRELVDGYRDEGDDGVFGYGGRLDIRPPYQREFSLQGLQDFPYRIFVRSSPT